MIKRIIALSNFQKVCMVFTLLSLIIMLRYAGARSLWADDLATISFVGKNQSLTDIIQNIKSDSRTVAPAFYIFAFIWIRIIPYGTFYLKLPSIIFSAFGMYLCASIARTIRSERAGIFTSIFITTSSFLIINGAFTFRTYGLLFFLSSLIIWVYIKRFKKANILSYGAVITLLFYTHYFGILLTAPLFITDIILLYKRRIRLNQMLSYLVPLLLFGSFFVYVLKLNIAEQAIFWPSVPSLNTFVSTFKAIFNYSDLLVILFFAGTALCFISTISSYVKDFLDIETNNLSIYFLLISIIGFILISVFLYSVFINPKGSIFVNRYFICTIPMASIISSIGLDFIFEIFFKEKLISFKNMVLYTILSILALYFFMAELAEINKHSNSFGEAYLEASDWIYEQPDAHKPDTLVSVRAGDYNEIGAQYYLTHDGARPALNFGFITESNYVNWNTVYCFAPHGSLPKESENTLNKYYKVTDENKSFGSPIKKYIKK